MQTSVGVAHASGCPVEIRDAVPIEVADFAQRLVADRNLAAGFEVESFSLFESSVANLTRVFAPFAEIEDFAAFIAWMQYWIKKFGEHAQAHSLRLKMVHSRRPMCPRFHTDNVHLRFITALTGPGSEWLRAEDVQIQDDGRVAQDPESQLIQRIQAGSVAYFRGTAGETVLRKGVVHRSPSEEVDRVVLTMDIAG